ncbi:quinone oxidoreductase family protein [Silvimonas iriomotensis]|uniref:Quinone oxidoreductase n=1 Tax=Silvimonas iriomotensis TaxID=449662 RepID=A0ABQ2PBC3_9NEIS|nr:quinone oxidoreductase [Silvimonas iriomotensis]GGP22405.1 quinone oxidoreductase [Silvimonas iriomotensis]
MADTHDIRIELDQYGSADVMQAHALELAPPAAGEVRVRHLAIGVNYVDVYQRSGLYPLPALPGTPGVEAVGVIEALGTGVDGWRTGQRVAYARAPVGAYASVRNVAASMLISVPDEVETDPLAAVLMRGMTAHMLFHHVRPLQAGETVLIHAAAGGLGVILSQWARQLGATVIGTVSTQAKAGLARSYGTHHAIVYQEQNWSEAVLEITGGAGVNYAIDGIGGDTLLQTLGVVRNAGMVASVGQVAGTGKLADTSVLTQRGIGFARPSILGFVQDLPRYHSAAADVLTRMQNGLRSEIGQVLPLAHAAQAHQLLESGRTTGALLLRP